MSSQPQKHKLTLRERIFQIIFESDTPAAKAFDIALIIMILVSVVIIMLDSVVSLKARYGEAFLIAEWCFTGIFTVEYLLRLYCLIVPGATPAAPMALSICSASCLPG